MANAFGIAPMTAAELTSGLPAAEVTVLNSNGGLLLNRTPLWYYVLREAAVLGGGNQLGPVGARILAETFVRLLKRDAGWYLNVSGGFSPILPSTTVGDFTVAHLVTFAGVTVPNIKRRSGPCGRPAGRLAWSASAAGRGPRPGVNASSEARGSSKTACGASLPSEWVQASHAFMIDAGEGTGSEYDPLVLAYGSPAVDVRPGQT
jgi:hypothetical protein